MKNQQNICYTLQTKDSASQSLRTKGAAASLNKIEAFLDSACTRTSVDNTSIEFHLFGVEWRERKHARRVYDQIVRKYGKPDSAYSSFGITKLLWGIHETNSWKVTPDALREALELVDSLGPLPELSSRPPVYVVAFYKFWLKHANLNSQDKSEQSSMVVFLSHSSNTGAPLLVTGFQKDDATFRKFRVNTQRVCPFELKDKYFYVRKYNKSGDEFYLRLYPNP